MPVVVTSPLQGEAVGPGTIIRASTQSVLPVGHHWDVLVFEAGKSDTLAEGLTFVEGQAADFTLGVRTVQPGQYEPIFQRQPAAAATAGEFELHVRVISAQSTILDASGPIGIHWRPDPAGVAYVQSLQTQGGGTTDGFTETDRLVAESTNASVLAQLPLTVPAGGLISLGIDQLVKGPPIDFLAEGENLLLTGRGTITRAVGAAGVYAYGGRWSVESVPPGLGRLDGQAVLYEQRIAQFVVVKNRLGGGSYAFQIEDSHYDSGELSWPLPFPVRIDYDILPGVTVRWRWLLLLQ